jgi:hypothetical protein
LVAILVTGKIYMHTAPKRLKLDGSLKLIGGSMEDIPRKGPWISLGKGPGYPLQRALDIPRKELRISSERALDICLKGPWISLGKCPGYLLKEPWISLGKSPGYHSEWAINIHQKGP